MKRLALLFLFLFLLIAVPAHAADVQLSQFTDSPDPAVRGGLITYTLNIENNADDTATNVVLSLPLPATSTFVSLTGTGCSHDSGTPGTVTCNIGSLLGTIVGGSVSTVTVTLRSTAATGATLNAIATITSDADTNMGNNSLSQTTTIDDGADLVLTKSGLPNPVTAGGNVTWTVGVTNQGPNDSLSVTVTDTLPTNMTYVSASGTGWSCGNSGQIVTCTRSSLANGATAPDISIVGQVTGAVTGTLTNTVTASAETADPNPANTVTANVTVVAGADLAIGKTLSPNPALSGQTATFTLTPRNNGPHPASTVTVTDTLPAGFTYVSAVGSGWACIHDGSPTGGVVTCTRAAYVVGATDNITIVTTAPTVLGVTAKTNSAAISSSVTADPALANNSATLNFNVVPDGVDLGLTKTKTPNPVAQNAAITSTLTVHNYGPQAAASGTITLTDTLDIANESYTHPAYTGTNWTCNFASPVITCIYNAVLASGANAPVLTITTTALGVGTVTNNADVSYSGTPGDWNSSNNAASGSVTVTFAPNSADLSIVKATSTAGGVAKTLENTEDIVTYTLTVSNAGPGSADGVVVTDAIPGYASGAVTASKTGGTSTAAFSCTTGATVTCTQTSGVIAKDETAIFTITAARPLHDGTFTNTANVTSTTLGDPNRTNNSASDTITIDPIADVQMQSKIVSPASVKAGVNATYVMTYRNNGPSSAQGVVVTDSITVPAGDSGFTVISINSSQGICSGLTAGSSYGAGVQTLTCTIGTLTDGQSETLTLVIRPNWEAVPPVPHTHTNTASITTTTWENTAHTDNGNNSQTATLTIDPAVVDLLVNKTDSAPAGPDPLGFDPVTPSNNIITYKVSITNRGPSLATGVVFTDTITPPAGKQITFVGSGVSVADAATNVANICTGAGSTSGAGTSLATTCTIGSDMAVNATVDRYLAFRVNNAPAVGGDTYSDSVTVTSNEDDSNLANNTEGETTTVRVRADLSVTKAASVTPVQLRQPFYWTITVTNNGPGGDSEQTTLTDTLPTGMSFFTPAQSATATAPYNAAPYNGGPVWTNTNATPGSGVCSTNGQALSCNFGKLETTKVVTLKVPVRVDTYAASYQNCATAVTSEVDPNSVNNTNQCGTVTVQRSSLAGFVYRDLNNNGAKETGETGINSVTLTLTGTDDYGNAITGTIVDTGTGGTGAFSFDNLSPSTAGLGGGYTITETQPAANYDGKETAGTAGGTAANAGYDATVPNNRITAIPLAGNTAATDYLFGELPGGAISGYVYSDVNNDGDRATSGEAGIPSLANHITLSGTTYNGLDVCTVITCTVSLDASGLYNFTNLPPSDGTGYTITQNAQPTGYYDGKDQKGDGVGTVIASSAGRQIFGVAGNTNTETITGVTLTANETKTEYNFGELLPATLSGYVFIDTDGNAARGGGETTGMTGVTVTLTGTDDLGNTVNTSATTAANGSYSFTGLRPGTYTITETPPSGALTHTGAQAGSLGGTISGSVRTSGTAVQGSGVTVISAITVAPGNTGTDYNFGENGKAISGFVYVDLNNNGTKDAGEPGIPGITVTLSGTTSDGVTGVCAAINPNPCTKTTDANGAYSFSGLPASNGAGYTITEMAQATAPLSNYLDGIDTVGSLGGSTAVNDVISGIPLGTAADSTNNNFGELGGAITGRVYHDKNDNGSYDAGTDAGIGSVTITLSGQTAGTSGNVSVCTVLPSCTFTTASDGTFNITGLPKSSTGGYTLTETQPVDYANRTSAAGTGGGTAGDTTITGITVAAGATVTDYLFGEKTGAMSGFVYLDANNDGVKAATGEPGIAGVTVTLSGTTASGVDVCTTTTCTTTTASDGSYSFTDLRNAGAGASRYTITETQPVNYLDGKETAGTQGGTAANTGYDATAANNRITLIPFSAASAATGYNFGERTGSISGTVYYDVDNSGSLTGGDTGIAGVTITLSGTTAGGENVCTVIAASYPTCSVTTASDGTYSLIGLPASNGTGYTLTETQPVDYANHTTTAGTAGGSVTGTTISAIVLGVGVTSSGNLFGEKTGAISGFVYHDANDDGAKDAGESGIVGVTLTLSGTTASGANVCTFIAAAYPSCTVTTIANGSYSFSGLPNANGSGYTITETQPAGYLDGKETAGTQLGTVDNTVFNATAPYNRIAAIPFSAASTATGYNFGDIISPGLAGKVYHDANNSNSYDTGEELAGVTITLTGTDDQGTAVNLTTTTATDGTYSFSNLRPSNGAGYIITETQPLGVGEFPGLSGIQTGTIGGVTTGAAGPGANQISTIVLGSGQTGINYNFREDASSLAGFVYIDANDNGAKDALETPIPGVTITMTGTDANSATITRTTTTAADGSYKFIGMTSGTYTLVETQPVNYQDGKETAGTSLGTVDNGSFTSNAAQNSISAITLPPATAATGYLFGDRAGSIAGTVYHDKDDSGTNNAGDVGIAGVTITLSGTTASGVSVCTLIPTCTFTTASDGTFSLTGLPASGVGGYTLTETQPVDYANRTSAAGTGGGTAGDTTITGITVAAGANVTNYLFGEKTNTISGFVYLDANNDGVKDPGETGVGGVTVTLSGMTASNVDVCTTTTCTATTASDGSYSFIYVRNANGSGYTVTETQPVNYLDGKETAGTQGGTAANAGYDATAANNRITTIPFSAVSPATGYNFGERTGSITGTVYYDADHNGSMNGADTGLAGVTITLSGTTAGGENVCTVIAAAYPTCSVTTASDGTFSFIGLPASGVGGYTLTESQPVDYADRTTTAGTAGGSVTGTTISTIVLGVGVTSSGNLFGEKTGAISGFVYHDANDNGVKDGGEAAIAGVTMTLSGLTASGANVCTTIPSCTTTTDVNGAYSFSGLRNTNGSGYTITESQPAGYLDGKETAGTQGGTVDNTGFDSTAAKNRISAIPFSAAAAATGYNFGDVISTGLSGKVYHDANNNTTYEAGEELAGVTITLTGKDDQGSDINLTTTTATDGTYSFINLRPSNATGYILTETQPLGVSDFSDVTGTQRGTIGGVTTGTAALNQVTGIVLASSQSGINYNFREDASSLAGFVYIDDNNNGAKDTAEYPIPGVTITLTGTDANSATITRTTTTAADGSYKFIGMTSGTYTLTETQPVNYQDGKETAGTSLGTVDNGSFTSNPAQNSISAITLPPATAATGYLFGDRAGSISGTVYYDANDNGSKEPAETGIAGVIITLSGLTASGVSVCTLIPTCTFTTAANGTFTLNGLPASGAGGYTLTETQPVDYADRTTAAGTGGGAVTGTTVTGITLGVGGNAANYLFGEKTGAISGKVYHDVNNNGISDDGPATGIAGVTLTLSGLTASGADICTPPTASCTTTTVLDGTYTFTGLRNASAVVAGVGGYTITETQATDYLDGKETAGTQGGIVDNTSYDATPAKNSITAIPFSATAAATDYNFGEISVTSVAGRVYHDAKPPNAIYDTGEQLAGVTLRLTGTDDQGLTVNLTTTTAADGTYSFTNLRPTDSAGYTVTETQPTGIINFPGTAGTQVGTVNGSSVGAIAAVDQISGIVLGSAQHGINYNFREDASSISGLVYNDVNENGSREPGEPGIAGVIITLTGTDANGSPVNRTTTTAADGTYSFLGLTSGTYTVTETQPVIYVDGTTTAGTAGGNATTPNVISTVTIGPGAAATGYVFSEKKGLPGGFSGTVWFNTITRDQTKQTGEPGLAGWIVQVKRAADVTGPAVDRTTTTAADGTWSMTGLDAAAGYEIIFHHPTNNVIYGDPVQQDSSYPSTNPQPTYANHTIDNMTLASGGNVTKQNLPVDPSGVVYDSITRLPVSGATVAISGPAGFDAATHLAGGTTGQSQTTTADGFYQFLLLTGAPAGIYTLAITTPPGYVPGTSTIIPPTSGPFNPGTGTSKVAIQVQPTAPTGAAPTIYYMTFTMSGASNSVVNNHIPVDPILGGAIRITKVTPIVNVSVGEMVPYTIEATNTLAATIPNIDLVDQVPPGFKYRSGSARLNGVAVEPLASGRSLRWPNLTFAPAEKKTLKLLLVVGAGVTEGNYTNQAWCLNNIVNAQVSNIAEATVRVVPDPTFDCTDIIGKVFDDRNANGYQDDGEPGIPNVRVVTARGWLITTDADGRFHVACAAIPQADRGSNFIMKLDERTLPSGFRVTTENPRVVRATRGKMIKLNFGATIHRVVRVEVSDSAFSGDGTKLQPDWSKRFDDLPNQLREKPSVVRLAYRIENGNRRLAQERMDNMTDLLRKRWEALNCCYPLSIEQEMVEVKR